MKRDEINDHIKQAYPDYESSYDRSLSLRFHEKHQMG